MRNEELWVPAAKLRSVAVSAGAEEETARPGVPEELIVVPVEPKPDGGSLRRRGVERFADRLGGTLPRAAEGGPDLGSGPSPPPGPGASSRSSAVPGPPGDSGQPGPGGRLGQPWPGLHLGAAEGRRASHAQRRSGSRAAATRTAGHAVRGGNTQAQVTLVSRSQRLQDEVSRVAAAAGLDLEVLPDVWSAAGRNPEVLLLGIDAAGTELPGRFRHGGPERHRAETILVGTGQDTGLWEAAARLNSVRVAVLPAASGWLAEYLSRRRALSAGYVLGVMGGCGGAGASSLSCWLAHEAAEQGVATLLVDGDPHGGGLDASLASGNIPGVRWPDLADVRGSLNPVQLVSALPQVSGFALLSGASRAGPGNAVLETAAASEPADAELDGTLEPAEESIRAVMDAARVAFALTVVDCARRRSGPLLSSCDAVLLVVPGRLRPVLAARSLHRSLGAVPQAVVIRGPLGDGLDDARAAGGVGLPLAGYLPAVRNLEHSEARGLLLERGRRARIRRLTGHLVRQLASELPEASVPDSGAHT